MSAYDEFCGCGGYDCRQCFNEVPEGKSADGNAWLDEAITANAAQPTDTPRTPPERQT